MGTLLTIGFSFAAGIGSNPDATAPSTDIDAGHVLVGPVLSEVNADIGTSPNMSRIPVGTLCAGCVFFCLSVDSPIPSVVGGSSSAAPLSP